MRKRTIVLFVRKLEAVMRMVKVERDIAAEASVVWALLEDFEHIAAFNPNLAQSLHIKDAPREGLGAERRCDLKDGRNWIKERVVDWRPGEGYTVEIYAGTLPIRDVRTTLAITPTKSGSRAAMQISYAPKYGLLGEIMDRIILRRRMRGLMEKVLEGLDEKSVLRAPAANCDV
jgi:uncharacterized protein YndB with AHSA1/START domain